MYNKINIRIKTYTLFFNDSIRASITNLSSGIKDITLNSLASHKSRKTITELPAPAGMRDEITIMESNIFHPSLKKSNLFFSAKNLIDISNTKKTVTKISPITRNFTNQPSKSYVLMPTIRDENKITTVTEI